MDIREEILKLVEKDSRITAQEIGNILDVSEEFVAETLIELEEERIIVGYHTLIDWDKTDDDMVSAMIEVRVNPQQGRGFDRIAAKIYQFPEVDSLYLMSGRYDFSVELKKAPMKEIARFVSSQLSTIEEVQSTSTHIILKKYKDHGTLFMEDNEDKRQVIL